MKIKNLLQLFLLFSFFQNNFAQAPHLSGTIEISRKQGLIKADLTVSNIPRMDSSYIRLNTGMNIKSFRDSSGTNFFYPNGDSIVKSEYFNYFFPANDNVKHFLPKAFKINYVGAFPVFQDTLEMPQFGDWKGNIAFNQKTLRASEQTAWYPILYDINNDRDYAYVTYDLTVNCADCKTIYLNGSTPVQNTSAHLVSTQPVPLMLYVGDYEVKQQNKTYFLNSNLTDKDVVSVENSVTEIKNYYEKQLKTPYGKDVTFIETEPVSVKNNWMFVTYPTIVVINRNGGMKNAIDSGKLTFNYLSLISHELGHYYFGSVVQPNSELRWMFLEGFTEYLSLTAVRRIMPYSFYKMKLEGYQNTVGDGKFIVPINKIQKQEEINETYRYNYVPLLLTALENTIHHPKLWAWMKYMLDHPNEKTNYDWFKKSLLDSGVTPEEFSKFESLYINDPNAVQNVFDVCKKMVSG